MSNQKEECEKTIQNPESRIIDPRSRTMAKRQTHWLKKASIIVYVSYSLWCQAKHPIKLDRHQTPEPRPQKSVCIRYSQLFTLIYTFVLWRPRNVFSYSVCYSRRTQRQGYEPSLKHTSCLKRLRPRETRKAIAHCPRRLPPARMKKGGETTRENVQTRAEPVQDWFRASWKTSQSLRTAHSTKPKSWEIKKRITYPIVSYQKREPN